VFQFTKEDRAELDRVLERMSLSQEERYIVIGQLEAIIARAIGKLLARQK
jgi:hypothetical protein